MCELGNGCNCKTVYGPGKDNYGRDKLPDKVRETILRGLFVSTFNDIQKRTNEMAVAKGFWPATKIMKTPDGRDVEVVYERSDGELLALAAGEIVGECLEAIRTGNGPSEHIPEFTAAEEELADCVIRLMDFAEARGHRLAECILRKMDFNATREQRHGKAF